VQCSAVQQQKCLEETVTTHYNSTQRSISEDWLPSLLLQTKQFPSTIVSFFVLFYNSTTKVEQRDFPLFNISKYTQLEIKYGERLGGFIPLLPGSSSFLHPQIIAQLQTIHQYINLLLLEHNQQPAFQ